MNIKGVMQHDVTDCGAACLATIAGYWKLKIPLVKVREMICVDKDGANIYAIVQVASQLGFDAVALEGNFDDLKSAIRKGEIILPAIVHVIKDGYLEHFIVLLELNEKRVKIFDPAIGKRSYTIDAFNEGWTGYIISLKCSEKFIEKNLYVASYRRYIDVLKKQKKLIMIVVIFSLFIALLSVITSLTFQKIIDQYAMPQEGLTKSTITIYENLYSQVTKLIGGFPYIITALIGCHLVQQIIEYLRGIFLAHVGNRIDKELMKPYYRHLLRLPVSFFQNRTTGEIISRYQDIGEIRDMISDSTLTIILDSIMLFAGAFVLVKINLCLFLVVLVIAIFYLIITFVFRKPISTIQRTCMEKNAKVISELKESVDGMESIKALNIEQSREKSFNNKIDDYLQSIFNGTLIVQLLNNLTTCVDSIGSLMIFAIGIFLVMNKAITLGSLIAFQGLVQYFLSPLKNLLMLQPMLQKAFVAADRLNDVLEVEEEQKSSTQICDLDFRNTKIIFRNVRFQFGYREPILKGINLDINSGEKIAIVGKSGCGKTTFLRMINAFYRPTEGQVLFGDVDSIDIPLDEMRKKIAYVPQDPVIFNESFINNILQSEVNINNAELENILKGCALDEFIDSLGQGKKRGISENGKNLSGGQRQRIALARALAKKPQILLIDEGTSHLDTLTEGRIIDYLLKEYENLTIIFVTHNQKFLDKLDRVVFMENGVISRIDEHQQLRQ